MGKKSNWFSIFKKVFASSSKDRHSDISISIQGSENEHVREKKRWVFGKSKKDEISSIIPLSRQLSSIEQILEDAENEHHQQQQQQQQRMHPVLSKKIQQSKSPARKARIIPNYAHMSAIKIQAAYRGYRARQSYRALKGLMRLQRVVRGQSVKRQTKNTLRCMQMLVRAQLQIRDRRLQMMESRSIQSRQSSHMNEEEETEANFGKWNFARKTESQGFEDWDDSVLTKEEVEERMRRKVEAVMRRERALAYAYTHQLLKVTPRSAEAMLTDLRTGRAPWWWSWLESQLPGPNHIQPLPIPRMQTPSSSALAALATRSIKTSTPARRQQHCRHYTRLKHDDADDASLTSCPAFAAAANYMAPTVSAQAKARSHRAFTEIPKPKKKRFSVGLEQSIGSLFAGKETGGGCSGPKSLVRQGRHRSTQSVGGMSVDSIVSLPVGAVVGSGRRSSFK